MVARSFSSRPIREVVAAIPAHAIQSTRLTTHLIVRCTVSPRSQSEGVFATRRVVREADFASYAVLAFSPFLVGRTNNLAASNTPPPKVEMRA
jgi:hypothetical protein